MGFVVRQLSKRADGGDITRTRRIDSFEITVGRGTDCDIQLADLGVMLRHARLSQSAGGMVAVEATGGIPLEIAGKFVNRADLVVADAPTIDIASHRLTLSPGDTPDTIAITAERVIAADAADMASETGVFSLQGTLPGKRMMAWGLAGLVLLAFLAGPLFTPPQPIAARSGINPDIVWTSGPLSTAHAGLSNNCGACHQQRFVSVTDSACTACHQPETLPVHAPAERMAGGRVAATGLAAAIHTRLNLPEGRCASCHKEHEGPRGALLVAENFCTDCHIGLSSRLADTKLADVPDWENHPQFKATLVTSPSPTAPKFERVSLAARPRENSGLVYPHQLHLSATNSVANMVRKQGLSGRNGALACNYCHTPDSDGIRFKPIEMERNCAACHDLGFAREGGVVRTLPHGKPEQVAGIVRDFYVSQAMSPRAGIQRIAFERRPPGRAIADLRTTGPAAAGSRADAAITAIFKSGGVCADCHAITDTGAGDIAQRFAVAPVTLADHYLPKGRFPHKRHETYNGKTGDAACTACHTGVPTSKLSSDVLLPAIAGCRECHGSTRISTNVPATCNTCHGFHYGEGGHGGDAINPTGATRRTGAKQHSPIGLRLKRNA